jgi:hypothetical protein
MRRLYRRGELIPIDDLMRKVAKHIIGRTEWGISQGVRHNTHIFPPDLGDWTQAQKFFVYWSTFYDGVFQHFERPPDKVILDDKLIEKWLEDQHSKGEVRANENWTKAGVIGEIKTAADHPEVIIMDGGMDWEEEE